MVSGNAEVAMNKVCSDPARPDPPARGEPGWEISLCSESLLHVAGSTVKVKRAGIEAPFDFYGRYVLPARCDRLRAMQKRKLRIVKRTPVALGICERCNAQFHSKQPVEDNAEIDM